MGIELDPFEGWVVRLSPAELAQVATFLAAKAGLTIDGQAVTFRLNDVGLEILFDAAIMKRFEPKYNPETARRIAHTLPDAYADWRRNGGTWGPGLIGRKIGIRADVVARYFRAWRVVAAHYGVPGEVENLGHVPLPGRKAERKSGRKTGREKGLH